MIFLCHGLARNSKRGIYAYGNQSLKLSYYEVDASMNTRCNVEVAGSIMIRLN